MEYLYILQQGVVWIITIFWLYQLLISICSLVKLKDKPLLVDKEHKFMAIIPAHNEEHVVGNLIESLKKQNYPKELFDIYVIADNCTDNTARIAEDAGAIVYIRNNEEGKTKGHALQWFLSQKIEENADYDAFCVFDADNIVDENFIKNMNKKLCQGEDVVQGYRDIKNPTDSWISSGYAIFYWMMNRFYHLARYNLGLSWQTYTLTEDIEFSLQRIIAGKKLGWATDAIVYDEQPVGFRQSWSQRSRWTVGHIQCMGRYTKALANSVKENKTLTAFDGLLYIVGSIPMFVITIGLLFVNALIYLGDGMTRMALLQNYLMYNKNRNKYTKKYFIIYYVSTLFIIFIKMEKRPIY